MADQITSPEPSAEPSNPYVGPQQFDEKHRNYYFGRDREARDLLSVVIAHRLVLFYAPSGAGKSSLLKVRLIPGLRSKDVRYLVLPLARVGGALSAEADQIKNVYAFNVMTSIDGRQEMAGVFADMKLKDFMLGLHTSDGKAYTYSAAVAAAAIAERARGQQDAAPSQSRRAQPPHVLIIDQSEEIVTTHPTRWQDREKFFQQLNEALEDDPQLWVVLAMRSDYVPEIERYTPNLPNYPFVRFAMERMGAAPALEAVEKPAARKGHRIAADAAEEIVRNLLLVREKSQDAEAQVGEFVQPVQLQVVCYQMWEGLEDTFGEEITIEDLKRLAGGDLTKFVDNALGDFYEDRLRQALALKGLSISETKLRTWFSDKLITEAVTRGFLNKGKTETEGMPNQVVEFLEDKYLLRVEARAGAYWYELVHDRFIDPIRTRNRTWFDRNLNPLTVAARAWKDAGYDAAKLYTGSQQIDASAQLVAHPADFGELEQQFVAVGQVAQRQRALRRQRTIFWGAVALLLVFGALTVLALLSRGQARRSEARAVAAATRALNAEATAVSERATALVAAVEARKAEATAGDAKARAVSERATALVAAAEARKAEATAGDAKARAEAASTESGAALAAAQAANTAQVKAVNDLAVALQTSLAAQATATQPPPPTAAATLAATPLGTPTSAPIIPGPPLPPTPTGTPIPTSTVTPPPTANLIVFAQQTQLAQVRATQTALAKAPFPDDQRIAFISTRKEGSNLFIVNARGEGKAGEQSATWILLGPCDKFFAGCFEAGQPTFGADGRQFLFHMSIPQQRPGRASDIFLANLLLDRAEVLKNLTWSDTGDWDQMDGSWSPDGNRIAYLSTEGDLNRIWLMNIADLSKAPLTSGIPYKDEQPSWSPDGAWIAVSSQLAGSDSWEIHLVSSRDGSQRKQITRSGTVNRAPAWSPDSKRLAFARGSKLPEDICIINIDGSGLRCKTTNTSEDLPVWSPRGDWIAFHRFVDSVYKTEIFIIRADFSEEYRITYNQADDWGPAWVSR